MDDCGPEASRNGNCVDEVNGYTCDCDEDHELILLVNGPVCVAKDCEIFFSNTVQWNRRECERASAMMPWLNSRSGRVHERRSRGCDVTGASQVDRNPRNVCSVEGCVGE